jgi:hypothetical protein
MRTLAPFALRRRWGAALAACALALTACSKEPEAAAIPPLPTFALREVVAPMIAELQAKVDAADAAERASWGPLPAELDEQVGGLVTFLSTARSNMADAAFEDIARLGNHAIDALIQIYQADGTSLDDKRSCLRLLGELDSPLTARFLSTVVGSEREALLRAVASWKLARLDYDMPVLALIKQLKYEKDAEALDYHAKALAAQGNFAGLAPLTVLVGQQGPDGPANQTLWQIGSDAGYDNPYDLIDAWHSADPSLTAAEPHSDRFRLSLWTWIQVFTEFQLRGVDDGRYIITDLGAECAAEVASALHDTNRYVRVHVAQSLGRMGRRGESAAPQLAQAIGDPFAGAAAVEALGEVCSTRRFDRKPAFDAFPAIETCTLPGRDLGLQLSAVRALGSLGDPRGLPILKAYSTPDQIPEFRQAALEGLVLLSDLEPNPHTALASVDALVRQAQGQELDVGSTMRALLDWMQRGYMSASPPATQSEATGENAPQGEPNPRLALFDAALQDWNQLEPNAFVPPTAEENAARKRDRLKLVESLIRDLRALEPEKPDSDNKIETH